MPAGLPAHGRHRRGAPTPLSRALAPAPPRAAVPLAATPCAPRGKPFIARTRGRAVITDEEDFAICVECGNPLENCQCVCAFCGERDECECALGDAATGG